MGFVVFYFEVFGRDYITSIYLMNCLIIFIEYFYELFKSSFYVLVSYSKLSLFLYFYWSLFITSHVLLLTCVIDFLSHCL